MARSRVGSGSNGARRQVATSASRSSSTPRNPPGRGAPTPPTSRRSTTGAPSRNPFRHAEIRSGLLMTCREREGWRGRRNSWRPRHTVLRLLPEGGLRRAGRGGHPARGFRLAGDHGRRHGRSGLERPTPVRGRCAPKRSGEAPPLPLHCQKLSDHGRVRARGRPVLPALALSRRAQPVVAVHVWGGSSQRSRRLWSRLRNVPAAVVSPTRPAKRPMTSPPPPAS
jgi:hypothetical protein